VIETRRLSQEAKEKWKPRLWALHHENAPRTKPTGFQVLFFLKENHGFPVVQQPPFPPGMAYCEFGCFPTLRSH